MLKIGLFALLTILTQIGGLIYILSIIYLAMSVKQETAMLSLAHNHNAHHIHANGMNGMNGISAPQPATMSLSGGNPMGFVNAVSFPPPMGSSAMNGGGSASYLGGLGLPQFPSLNEEPHNGLKLGGLSSPSALVPPPPSLHPAVDHASHETTDGPQNGSLFAMPMPMNVAPSVMAGGPPLTQM